jgi:glutaredoxin
LNYFFKKGKNMEITHNNIIYRKPDCPYGKKAAKLLKQENIAFEDHIFESKEEEQNLKQELHVDTTPQVFIEGERIGGYSALAGKFGKKVETASDVSYTPIIAIFSVTWLLTLATSGNMMTFMGYSLAFLACLKLMDITGFSVRFKKYDLVAKKFAPYSLAYPFLELFLGIAVLAGAFTMWIGALAVAIGLAGGYSIFQAVYIQKKSLQCACVGGGSNVPLGAVSILENAMMALMGIWSIVSAV